MNNTTLTAIDTTKLLKLVKQLEQHLEVAELNTPTWVVFDAQEIVSKIKKELK